MTSLNKALVAAVGAGAMLLSSSLTDGTITTVEWLQVVVAVVTSIQVWYVANTSIQPAVKAALAGILAALNFAIGIIPDHHFGRTDLINLVIAALTAAGVWSVANRGATRHRSVSDQATA